MTPAERFKEIEELFQQYKECCPTIVHVAQYELLGRVKRLTEALESIAANDFPVQDQEDYWLKVKHSHCAKTLATDTEVARKALEDE